MLEDAVVPSDLGDVFARVEHVACAAIAGERHERRVRGAREDRGHAEDAAVLRRGRHFFSPMRGDERVDVIARDAKLIAGHDHDGVEVSSIRPRDADANGRCHSFDPTRVGKRHDVEPAYRFCDPLRVSAEDDRDGVARRRVRGFHDVTNERPPVDRQELLGRPQSIRRSGGEHEGGDHAKRRDVQCPDPSFHGGFVRARSPSP
jgi:hypothetical protein